MRIKDNKNIERFTVDFKFELTKTEKDELIANCDRLTMKYGKPGALQQKASESRKPVESKTDKTKLVPTQ